MASLLSLLGGSSGLPFTLSDDEQQQLQQQQQDPTSGVSALMGVSGQDSTSQDTQPIDDATKQSLLSAVAQGSTDNADAQQPTDTSVKEVDAGTDNPPDQTDRSGDSATSAPADATASTDSAASQDSSSGSASNSTTPSSSDDSGGFANKLLGYLHRLESRTIADPNFGLSLMNAGFGMMGASKYGTPGLAAVGQGAQQGLQTYQALKQQQIANSLAQYQAQNKAAMDQADINAKNATTNQTVLANRSKLALQNYASKAGSSFNINDAISAGALPADAISAFQGMHPDLTMNTDDAGNVYAFNKQTGTNTKVGNSVKIANTAAGTTTTAYNGGGGGNGPIVPQVVQEGGLAPEQVDKNVAQYQAPQAAAAKASQVQNQMLNQLQSADALSGSGGGVLGAGWRGLQAKLGINDPNSQLRQQFAATNVQGIVSALPSGSRMDQNFLQQMEKTVTDPSTATPEQMIRATAFMKSKADYDSVDNETRAAFVAQNGGMETPLKKATTITVAGQTMNLPKDTTVQQAADAATKKLVNWDPPLINPQWADGKSQAQINQALAYSKPSDIAYLRKQGVLLPSNMRNGGQ